MAQAPFLPIVKGEKFLRRMQKDITPKAFATQEKTGSISS
jgi:hypothetical protein